MSLDNTWYTELAPGATTAFSLKIKEKVFDQTSEFQRVEVYDTENFGKLMTIDGLTMVRTRDNYLYHEMITHPALFTHPDPRRVLIIGGGDCGTLKEVLKHPSVEHVDMIEIDEVVTRAAEIHFPELCESNNDPRANIMFIDGIKWVHDTADGTYDLIIVDSTDPVGPAEGLFSKPFFEQAHRCLKANGIIVQQSESPLLHMDIIKGMYSAIGGAGFVDLATIFFPQPIYPSGWWSATMGCKDSTLTTFREDDAQNKSFATRYYNAAVHRAALTAPEFFYKEVYGE